MAAAPRESKVDVLVIGAGPSGLMCANALAHAGVKVRVIDQKEQRVQTGQADGIQPRTIEVLQSYGLAERLIKEGNQMHMTGFYNPGPSGGIERTGRQADVTAPTTRYDFEITLNQGAIEAIFLDSMSTVGVQVDRPIIPTSLEISTVESELQDPQAHPVKVTLKNLNDDSEEIVHAKFAVGADGAHSWTRKTLGITMEGEQTKYIWGVVDIIPESDFPDIRNRCVIHSDNGSCMVIPREDDIVRLYTQLSDEDVIDKETGRLIKGKITPEGLMQVANKSMKPYSIAAANNYFDWWTVYIIGQRVANQFSVKDRVFIAGDACHTHSPKAGQGMNASMNDTHNLAWKLAHVIRGWADISLLKTYEFERRKYARDLINFDKKFSTLFSGKPRTEANQDGVSHEEFLEAFMTFGAFTSGIGVDYPPSAIVAPAHQSAAPKLVIGERMIPRVFVRCADARPYNIQDLLPADTRFKLLVFLGDVVDKSQAARVDKLAEALAAKDGFLARFGGPEMGKRFELLSIASTPKEKVNYTDIPAIYRQHWSKFLLDDTDMYKRSGGGAYDAYGIDPLRGAIVVVRPDGFVGAIAPYENVQDLDKYFESFMIA